ncbi:MAG: dienelactone hydrolase family protein [Alphaproteobacteria bacterium]
MTNVTINAHDGGEFSGYLALPEGADAANSKPAVIVIQEIFGVNAVMRTLTDWVASQGFIALCPDLFWRQEPNIDITDQSDAEWRRAFELYQGFDQQLGVADLSASADFLKKHPACNGKIGSIGYCLGGRLAYFTASRLQLDACVSYYGVAIEEYLNEIGNIRKPLLMHMAEKDGFVPPAAQALIAQAVAHHPQISLHIYEGVDHAFARTGGKHYNQEAAELANSRSLHFLKQHLL